MENKFGALSSSVNPQELSLTVTSTVKFVLSLLVTTGYVSVTGAENTTELVPALVGAGYAAFVALEALYGLVRKVIVAITAK